MAVSNKLHSNLTDNSDIGGSIQVKIPATPFRIQAGAADANGASQAGVSQPCASMLIIAGAANTGACRVRVGTACSGTAGTTGQVVPKPGTLGVNACYKPMPYTDVNLLYFEGAVENDVVDIEWRG
jgi:hypothetical protein